MVQRLDDEKRREIMRVAARLFADRPFHEVKLDDVAAEAKVGKGTLYGYFSSKEDLHVSLVADGFERLIGNIREGLGEARGDPWEQLQCIVAGLVSFSRRQSCLLRLMRNAHMLGEPRVAVVRAELADLVASVIEGGVERGIFVDPSPALTAQFVLAFVRAANLYGPPDLSEEALIGHVMHLLRHGLGGERGALPPGGRKKPHRSRTSDRTGS